MEILAPQHNTRLYGQDAAVARFMQAVQGRLHHAWLLHGPSGIGKTTFAFHCANHLLSGGVQPIGKLRPEHKDFKLIAAGAHPDLQVVAPPLDEKTGLIKDEIPVAAIRDAVSFFRLTSGREGWRIVIIRNADQMNRNAANALLKMLEEPPRRALLLMTATARGRLLPTIRSRCRPLALQPMPPETMTLLLEGYQDELSPAELRQLHRLSAGSPGQALQLLRLGGLQLYRDFLNLMQSSEKEQLTALLRFAGAGGKQEGERQDLIARFSAGWLQRLAHLAATGEVQEITEGEAQLQRRQVARRPAGHWLDLLSQTEEQWRQARAANLDKRLVIINNLQQVLAAA